MKDNILVGILGLTFGFALSRIGFSSWDEVNAMFRFTDLRLTITFAWTVIALAFSWFLVSRVSSPRWAARNIHQGTLVGGALFGVGWALSGACPSIALVQLGEGQLAAVFTITGILAGNWLYSVVHERFFRWPTGNCLDG